jgi:hypothetical protein
MCHFPANDEEAGTYDIDDGVPVVTDAEIKQGEIMLFAQDLTDLPRMAVFIRNCGYL